jgi:hypothetical protein
MGKLFLSTACAASADPLYFVLALHKILLIYFGYICPIPLYTAST